jgi:hypothetical protein
MFAVTNNSIGETLEEKSSLVEVLQLFKKTE